MKKCFFKKILFSSFFVYSFFMFNVAIAGDITLEEDQILLIENKTYTNKGNIFLKDNSKIIIRNSNFILNKTIMSNLRFI